MNPLSTATLVSTATLAADWLDELFAEETNGPIDVPDIVDWAEANFYIIETKRPIQLEPVQKAVLREFFRRDPETGRFIYRTGLYSTIKKSGKTTVAALVMQWATETWGDYGEIYHMGNKLKQAQQRAFKIAKRSIELSPNENDWEINATTLTHKPTQSVIAALPVNAAGEAGSNNRLVTVTEAHGYIYEESERMWTEMQPVPTQPLSFRFVESYAGYEGESNLLKTLWDRALEKGLRIHEDYPIYAIPDEGFIAYIDTGVEARRLPWQTADYYRQAEAEELPHEFQRLHLNQWVTSQIALVNIALWDRLEIDNRLQMMKSLSMYGEGFREGLSPSGIDVVIGVDASVSGDCTALSVVAYLPDAVGARRDVPDLPSDTIIELETYIWQPPKDGKIDYAETLKPALDDIDRRYRVLGVAYDEYQMHNFMTEYQKTSQHRYKEDFFYPFPQGAERVRADTALLNRIRHEQILHSGNATVRQHIQNADGKAVGESAIRIVKRDNTRHIDAVVALSMAAWRMYHLFTSTPQGSPVRRAKAVFR